MAVQDPVETCRANRHAAKTPCCWIERWRTEQGVWGGLGMQLLTEGGMPRVPSIRQVRAQSVFLFNYMVSYPYIFEASVQLERAATTRTSSMMGRDGERWGIK